MNMMSLAAALWLATQAGSVSGVLPSVCQGVDYSSVSGASEPEGWGDRREVWSTRVLNSLRQTPQEAWDDDAEDDGELAALRQFWREDSTALAWSLADVIGNDFVATRSDAARAASAYRRLRLPAGPVLEAIRWSADGVRQYEGLTAIDLPLSIAEERMVLLFACDALWLATQLAGDRDYWHRPSGVPWALRNREVLVRAFWLLSPQVQAGLAPAIAGALGPSVESRLNEAMSPARRRNKPY